MATFKKKMKEMMCLLTSKILQTVKKKYVCIQGCDIPDKNTIKLELRRNILCTENLCTNVKW